MPVAIETTLNRTSRNDCSNGPSARNASQADSTTTNTTIISRNAWIWVSCRNGRAEPAAICTNRMNGRAASSMKAEAT